MVVTFRSSFKAESASSPYGNDIVMLTSAESSTTAVNTHRRKTESIL
jgi:hypothetical protein